MGQRGLYYHGALYDGELVWEDDKLTYIVFDVVHTKGTDCIKLPYRERMTIVHNTILCVGDTHTDASIETMLLDESKFCARNNPLDLLIKPKTYVHKANLKELWEERDSCSHRNDGVIFTQNSAPIGTHLREYLEVEAVAQHRRAGAPLVGAGASSRTRTTATSRGSDRCVRRVPLRAAEQIARCLPQGVLHRGVRRPSLRRGKRIELFAERERTDKIAPNTLKTMSHHRNDIENISPEDDPPRRGHDVLI